MRLPCQTTLSVTIRCDSRIQPERVLVGAHLVRGLNTISSRSVDPSHMVVVGVGRSQSVDAPKEGILAIASASLQVTGKSAKPG